VGRWQQNLGEVQACSGLAHDPHGKLGLRAKVNDVTYERSVHMYQ
jgi:hypothetical protein